MASYVLQEMPNGMGKGECALYPKLQIYSMYDNDKVVKMIHSYSPAFSEGVIRGVLDGLATALKSALPNGHNVKVDGLGVFSLSLGFDETQGEGDVEGVETSMKKQKEKYRHVCADHIKFKVDAKLINDINTENTFERDKSGVKHVRKTDTTLEQRREKALELLQKHGFFTLDDYARANALSRSMASRELKRLTSDPTSGIAERGSHSHKVWVGRKQ